MILSKSLVYSTNLSLSLSPFFPLSPFLLKYIIILNSPVEYRLICSKKLCRVIACSLMKQTS